MKIENIIQSKRIHHSIKIDDKIYYRNEEFKYDFDKQEWVSITNPDELWVHSVDGKGPFRKPRYYKQLERQFKLLTILPNE